MALPINTSTIDAQTGYAVPASTGEWSSLTSWDSWKSWNIAATEMTVLSDITDRGSIGYFNLKTNSDVTGNIQYSVYSSTTGEFAGEETETIITPNTGNIGAFYGRYYAVAANVSDASGGAQLRSLNIISTNSRFDIQFNDLDSTTLTVGDNSHLQLPLPRTVSAVLNMSLTPHDATTSQAYYITTGNTGYIYDWYGSVNTKLTANIGPNPLFSQYMVTMSTSSPFANVHKTLDGVSWSPVGTLSNTGSYSSDAVDWSYSSTYFAYGAQDPISNNLRIFSRADDVFTKVADPATWPAGGVKDICFGKASDTYLAVAHANSPYVTIYSQSGGTFTKLSNPGSLPSGDGYAVAWDPSDTYLAVGHDSSPYLTVYSRSGSTFTKLSDPATLPSAVITSLEWDPTGTMLLISEGVNTSANVKLYELSGGTLTYAGALPSLPAVSNGLYNFAWNQSGNAVVVGFTGTSSAHPTEPKDFVLYRVYSGDQFAFANTGAVISQCNGVYDLEWGANGTQLYVAHQNTITNGRGLTVYDFNPSSNVFTLTTGITANVGNLYAVSGTTPIYSNYLYAANVAAFPSTGTIRVGNENMNYTNANVSGMRFEGVTRGQTDTSFGSSVASAHATGDEIVLTSSVDFSQRYYEAQTLGQAFVYVGSKDRTTPTVTIKDGTGTATTGTFDATITVMPEQYMDTTDLNTR